MIARFQEVASYDLPLPADGHGLSAGGRAAAAPKAASAHLPDSLLVRNAIWFCHLRWIVVALLALFGVLGQFAGLLPRFGLRAHPGWPFVAAAVLLIANLAYLAHARALARSDPPRGVKRNLWAQIVLDLVVLTVVVHHMGSLETYAAFAYLFHIVLACVFFPRGWSFIVTAIAVGLYLACVALEGAGVLAPASLYASSALRDQMDAMPGVRFLNVGWAMVTWAVVAYLTSHLSAMVRQRDSELAATNRRLLEAQRERARHMLHTTHELKAPFSAIHANVQLLLKGYCGALPDPALSVLGRITARCQRLAAEIQEMLQLANLQSKAQTPAMAELDLAQVLDWSIAQVRPIAAQREISVDRALRPARVFAVEDHMKMLLLNLLANAVSYSQAGGRVRVECAPQQGNGPLVTIEDHGIGIPADKLPHIFDAYYRTNEAVQHNKESTGLGLAIVQQVAEAHRVRVSVESAPGIGTRFILHFPPPAAPARSSKGKESDDGVPDDC